MLFEARTIFLVCVCRVPGTQGCWTDTKNNVEGVCSEHNEVDIKSK